jgi:tocopherol cyclase
MSSIWKPEIFQGRGRKREYFEGWYFKSVDRDERSAFAVIPGISISRDAGKSHAFVMVVDARKRKLHYAKYPLEEFRADRKRFEITIGKNLFSLDRMALDIDDGSHRIRAAESFGPIRPWPVTILSPGTMGWYAFVPLMECYHATLSFDHAIEGFIEIDGVTTDFSGGKGYLEKDWGRSMPSSWIWMQTNHFDTAGVSLFGSVAKIPWGGSFFTGFIFGLLLDGKVHRFATYSGARVDRLELSDRRIELTVEDSRFRLEISADRTEGVDLPAPALGEMTAKVNESLRSRIRVGLYGKSRSGLETLFEGEGRNAGLEFVGDIGELIRGLGAKSGRKPR